MLTNKTNEEQNKAGQISLFDALIKFLFSATILFCIPLTLNFFIEYSTLNSRFFGAALLLFIISISLTLISILIYISPVIFQLIKQKSLTKEDLVIMSIEQRNPTKTGYKIRQVFVWSSSISAIVTLFAYIIYLFVLLILTV